MRREKSRKTKAQMKSQLAKGIQGNKTASYRDATEKTEGAAPSSLGKWALVTEKEDKASVPRLSE